jgi:hypothetical protein
MTSVLDEIEEAMEEVVEAACRLGCVWRGDDTHQRSCVSARAALAKLRELRERVVEGYARAG